jgi:hypothetical protein
MITLGNLASMRSGFDCGIKPGEPELIRMMASEDWVAFTLNLPLSDPPGQRFAYCSPGMHLLSAMLTVTSSESAGTYARRKLFDPLGIIPGDWPIDPSGNNHGWGDLRLLPYDMAKIGLLFLHDGVWDGNRVLPQGWVKKATRSYGPVSAGKNADGYGLGWWVPSGPLAGAFEARGRGGQRIVVIPELDLVVVTTGAGFEPGSLQQYLGSAIKQGNSLPLNVQATERLHQAIARARAEPAPKVLAQQRETAARVSGKRYRFATNPLGFNAISFEFPGTESAKIELDITVAMAATVAGHFNLEVGLNGQYRFTANGPRGYRVALRGEWISRDSFEIGYVEPAGSNAFNMRFRFEDNRVSAQIRDITQLYGEHMLDGTEIND